MAVSRPDFEGFAVCEAVRKNCRPLKGITRHSGQFALRFHTAGFIPQPVKFQAGVLLLQHSQFYGGIAFPVGPGDCTFAGYIMLFTI